MARFRGVGIVPKLWDIYLLDRHFKRTHVKTVGARTPQEAIRKYAGKPKKIHETKPVLVDVCLTFIVENSREKKSHYFFVEP